MLEKDVEAAEEDAARRAHRRKSTRAAPKTAAAADKAATVLNEDDYRWQRAPFPDSPRGILLLGDGDGTELIPMGIYTVENLSPSGITGPGMVVWSPSPFPATRPAAHANRRDRALKK
jgi:hypothetical protein